MKRFLLLIILLTATVCSFAHEAHIPHPAPGMSAIDAAFDTKGNLWRVSVRDGFLWVDKSVDVGKSFAAAIKVNPNAQKIGANNEARPSIGLDADDRIYVSWTQNLETRFAGYIWFARSIDVGKSFEKPMIVHQDRAEITHAFNALNVSPNGKITVTWIDKRDALNTKNKPKKNSKHAKEYAGAAIYYAVSNDHGVSFAAEKKLADHSCECCRIVTANKPDGTTTVLWRHVFEGSERDHMIAEIPQHNATAQLHRATFGHWQIDGCPHHGAALASGATGEDWWGYHLAYFDGNDASQSGPGLYYSRIDGRAWATSPAKKFGDNKKQAGRPAILSLSHDNSESVWLVWRESEANKQQIVGMHSGDGGRNWGKSSVLATTNDKADYPILLANNHTAYLLWNTAADGLQIVPLNTSTAIR